jgi:hypothetical protein
MALLMNVYLSVSKPAPETEASQAQERSADLGITGFFIPDLNKTWGLAFFPDMGIDLHQSICPPLLVPSVINIRQ